MIYLSRTILFLFLASIISFCTTDPIDIPNLDETLFQADRKGCHGERAQMKEVLMQIDTALKGLSQKQVQATLGKPDRHELAPRSQKYFVYYIEPGPECPNGTEEPLTMLIRFSALDRSTEVSFQNY